MKQLNTVCISTISGTATFLTDEKDFVHYWHGVKVKKKFKLLDLLESYNSKLIQWVIVPS